MGTLVLEAWVVGALCVLEDEVSTRTLMIMEG
jgi:hypothetical protein